MLAVVDERIPSDSEEGLKKRGFSVLKLPPHPNLQKPIASHPDMLLFFAPDSIYCTKKYQEIAKGALCVLSKACGRPIKTVEAELQPTYPHDVLLNAAPVGKTLFCSKSSVAEELLQNESYEICNVRQGYAKCSILPIGDDALITEDPSIAKAAREIGKDVLQVEQNAVRLSGYSTGFLGGCASFSPYEDTPEILFCGALHSHPNANEIERFCKEHGYRVHSLSSSPLTDVGSIFLV